MAKPKFSGKHRKFTTGAKRDSLEGKPRPELISPIFERRLAARLTGGADTHGSRNWEQGFPIDATMGCLLRHLNQYREGLRDEDHLAAAACNLMFIIHTSEMIERGLLPKELDDLPRYTVASLADRAAMASNC